MLGLFVKDQAESGWGVWLGIVGGLADELLCGDTGLTLQASFGTRSSSIPPIHDWSSGSENFLEPHRTVKWKERGADLVIGTPGSLAEESALPVRVRAKNHRGR